MDLHKKRSLQLFILGGLLGMLAFFVVLGFLPLDVTNDALARGGYIERDIQQHYAGWLFYRQSPLAFPLCIAQGIGGESGISVAFTDSIPLAAAFFRLLSPLLPATFQYFGLFTLLCLFLQGGFAALLCGLFAQGLLLPLLGSTLFVASPILWERVLRHTSLGAHWLLVGALYCYFRARRGGDVRCTYLLLFVLNVLTIGIHPYFVPMTYAITFALLVEQGLRHKKLGQAALYLGADLAATVALGWALGLFASGGSAGGGSGTQYGYYGMNLNALWNPVGVKGVKWSLFLPIRNQVGGNYDAFAYLGLGVGLALLAGGVFTLLRRLPVAWRTLWRHWPLAGVCGVLTVFAVSNVITANGATLAVISLPGWLLRLCSVFRSSGRMFWPVYYLLILGAFLAVARLTAKRWRLGLLLALVAVQLIDLAPGFAQRHAAVRQAYAQPAFPSSMVSNFWTQAAGRYTHIATMDSVVWDNLNMALYAYDNGMSIDDDTFSARYDQEAARATRAALMQELKSGVLQPDTLYLFGVESNFLKVVDAVAAEDVWCGYVGELWYLIAPNMDATALYEDAYTYGVNWPLRMIDYNDAIWEHGVLTLDRRIVCFYDTPFNRSAFTQATALRDGDEEYAILLVDDKDAGWLMVTLDIEDAGVLAGKPLEPVLP